MPLQVAEWNEFEEKARYVWQATYVQNANYTIKLNPKKSTVVVKCGTPSKCVSYTASDKVDKKNIKELTKYIFQQTLGPMRPLTEEETNAVELKGSRMESSNTTGGSKTGASKKKMKKKRASK